MLQLFNLRLIAGDHRLALRIHDPVEHDADFLLDASGFAFRGCPHLGSLGLILIPPLAEKFAYDRGEFGSRHQLAKDGFKRLFYRCPLDAFGKLLATTMTADIIGIGRVAALAEIGGHRMTAGAAAEPATKRKRNMDVRPRWRERFVGEPFLNRMKGGRRDQRLMLRLAKRYSPFLAGKEARINLARYDTMDLLIGQEAMATQRKFRMRLEEAFDLRFRVEAV